MNIKDTISHAETRKRRGMNRNERPEIDEITGQVVDAAVKLSKGLGPGLLESVYELVPARELER